MTCYHESHENINSQSAFCTQSAVCIFYPVCSLQCAFCTDRIGIAVFVQACLKSRPKYWSSKNNISEIILAAVIDVWTICWRAPEEKHNDRALITLYQLKTVVPKSYRLEVRPRSTSNEFPSRVIIGNCRLLQVHFADKNAYWDQDCSFYLICFQRSKVYPHWFSHMCFIYLIGSH